MIQTEFCPEFPETSSSKTIDSQEDVIPPGLLERFDQVVQGAGLPRPGFTDHKNRSLFCSLLKGLGAGPRNSNGC